MRYRLKFEALVSRILDRLPDDLFARWPGWAKQLVFSCTVAVGNSYAFFFHHDQWLRLHQPNWINELGPPIGFYGAGAPGCGPRQPTTSAEAGKDSPPPPRPAG